jgi:hypothetical protein
MLLLNAELYGLVLAPKLKKKRIPSNLGSQFATLGANVLAFINILSSMLKHLLVTLVQTTSQNAQSWPQVFLALTPSVKWALVC